MEFGKSQEGYIIRLDRGEELTDSLVQFAEEENLPGAFYHGIGALQDVTLAYFSPEKNDYISKVFYGNFEIISLNGNLSILDGKPFSHTHISLSDENFRLIGGHFVQGIVSVTVELHLTPVPLSRGEQEGDLNFRPLECALST